MTILVLLILAALATAPLWAPSVGGLTAWFAHTVWILGAMCLCLILLCDLLIYLEVI